MKKVLSLLLILSLPACALNERTKIIEGNVKNIQVYSKDGKLICNELPCPVKFNKEEGKSQTVKLKLDGFEGEEEISVEIWNFERYLRRTGSVSNVVLYPISIADAPITGVTIGTDMVTVDTAYGINPAEATTEDSVRGTTEAPSAQMRMVNNIWFYDPDHIYIEVELRNAYSIYYKPYELEYQGYGYKRKGNGIYPPEEKKMITLWQYEEDELITKRFVLHNYSEIKSHESEYMRAIKDLTGLETSKLKEIIDKSTSAPELAETLSHYPKKK